MIGLYQSYHVMKGSFNMLIFDRGIGREMLDLANCIIYMRFNNDARNEQIRVVPS